MLGTACPSVVDAPGMTTGLSTAFVSVADMHVVSQGRGGEARSASPQRRICVIHNPQALCTSTIWISINSEKS